MSKGVGILSKPTVRKGLITLVNQGVVSATNFLTGVVIGRTCTKDEFGLYMLGFSIVLFALDLQVSLVSTPYMIYRPRLRGKDLHLYKGSSLLHQIVLSLVLMAVLAAWGGAVSLGYGPPGLEPVLWALVAVIGFIMLREFVRRVCFADLRMEIVLIFDVCVALLQVGGLLLLAYYQVLSADRAYWVIGGACGLAGVGWILLNRKTFVVCTSRSLQDLKLNWTFGKWVFASGALWAISMNLYPWFLTSFHGTASAGVWGACLGILALVNVPLTGMQNFLGPKIANVYAEGGLSALRQFAFKSSAILCIVMSMLCCALFLFGEPLLVLLYGAKYTGNGAVVFILSLSLVAASVAFSFSRALFAVERADVDFKVNFVPLLVLFTCGLWLVRFHGPLGAAWGLLLANAAASLVRCASFAFLSRPSVERAA